MFFIIEIKRARCSSAITKLKTSSQLDSSQPGQGWKTDVLGIRASKIKPAKSNDLIVLLQNAFANYEFGFGLYWNAGITCQASQSGEGQYGTENARLHGRVAQGWREKGACGV
mgnify:CR=1 FL=1|tara:strand:+ start:3285 stop:3623 length:339 start_codon:yes stop_codon:yes gene_type:complete